MELESVEVPRVLFVLVETNPRCFRLMAVDHRDVKKCT